MYNGYISVDAEQARRVDGILRVIALLQGAVEDFSVTIAEMPTYGDAWMRRGQARAAMGKDDDALQDFQQCLKLTPEPARKVSSTRSGMLAWRTHRIGRPDSPSTPMSACHDDRMA